MKYGFVDESGSPGVAVNSNDFLIVSLVLFDARDDADKCSDAMNGLRTKLRLKRDYEFHCSRNASIAKAGMLQLISRQSFSVITVSIKKNQTKRTASYARIAQLLIQQLEQFTEEIEIKMDSNPILYKELKRASRASKLKYASLKQVKSHTDNLVQFADYIVNIFAKKMKVVERSSEFYRPLLKKRVVLVDVRE